MVQMKMIKMILTVMLFFAFAGSAFSYTEHSPIYIEGNSQFTDIRGVVSGNGVKDDPFIIKSYDIKTGGYGGIKIKNTDAYFIIRDCYIHGDGTTNGIVFEGVENGTVDKVELGDNDIGIYIDDSDNSIIASTTISGSGEHGIYIDDSDNSIIASTTISGSEEHGIYIDDSDNSIIASTTISGSGDDGIYIHGSANSVTDTTISDSGGEGIYIHGSANSIASTTIFDNGSNGVRIDGYYNKLFKCDITNNRQGIYQSGRYSNNNTASFCNIYNNEEYGVYNDSNNRFEAINCWWGSEDGPSGVGPGDGDEVGENIGYEPYLSAKEDIKSSE